MLRAGTVLPEGPETRGCRGVGVGRPPRWGPQHTAWGWGALKAPWRSGVVQGSRWGQHQGRGIRAWFWAAFWGATSQTAKSLSSAPDSKVGVQSSVPSCMPPPRASPVPPRAGMEDLPGHFPPTSLIPQPGATTGLWSSAAPLWWLQGVLEPLGRRAPQTLSAETEGRMAGGGGSGSAPGCVHTASSLISLPTPRDPLSNPAWRCHQHQNACPVTAVLVQAAEETGTGARGGPWRRSCGQCPLGSHRRSP